MIDLYLNTIKQYQQRLQNDPDFENETCTAAGCDGIVYPNVSWSKDEYYWECYTCGRLYYHGAAFYENLLRRLDGWVTK